MGYLHHALQSSSPVCHPLSCVSSFAWGCVQQRVEEPHSVPGYRVRLPEERSLEQPQEVRSACQPHMHAISSSAHRGGHRSVSLCRRTVEDRLPLERVVHWAMRQRKLGSHTPPCHRRMVITTLFSVLLAALQRRPVLYHTRWLLAVHWHCSSGHRGQLALVHWVVHWGGGGVPFPRTIPPRSEKPP